MKFGHFDNTNKEYVITKPDTPTPWINYIGGGEYGGIVSNTAGGYSFDKDPKNKRITRYRYNAVPIDQPGRYVFIRDDETKKYWSATWQPLCKSDDQTEGYGDKYECHHGMGYTTIKFESNKIASSVTYFVPDMEAMELWWVKVKNTDNKKRKLKLFSYSEFSFYDSMKDQTNVDWCQQINQANFKDNTIFWTAFMKTMGYTFFSSSQKAHSFDTSRGKFLGRYHSISNPQAVINGTCGNNETVRGNGVGCICVEIELAPGEEKEFAYMLGTGESPEKITPLVKKYSDIKNVHAAFANLKEYWNEFISHFQIKTPDHEMDSMMNVWNQYQDKSTFNWSRFVSLYQLGVNRGMGFRDTSQDMLGVVHTIPNKVKEKIKTLLKIQYEEGCAAHQFYPLTGEAAAGDADEGCEKAAKWYSDDHLWIVLSTCAYLKETGDFAFLEEKVPYLGNCCEGTVLEHLEKAINFSKTHVGEHGLTLAGWADWDDTLNLDTGKGKAESVWTTMLLGVALKEMIALYKSMDKADKAAEMEKLHKHFSDVINSPAGWDGEWYLRAYTDEGKKVGTHENKNAKIYLLSQSWPIMAGFATGDRARQALESAHKNLNTKYGLVLIWPAYNGFDWRIGGTTTYPPGAKENGGVFLQTNPWQMIAQAMMGNGDLAYQYYRQILPSAKNDIAEVYEVEPYVYCQNILGKEHPQFGMGRNSWLTGTASWNFVAASQYILGIKPDYKGLMIDPCIPKEWKEYEVIRKFRGCTYKIKISNPNGVSKGVKDVTVDGKEISGNIIPACGDKKEHKVEVTMG